MRTAAFIAILLVSVPVSVPPALAGEDNLLANGGFEAKLDGWMFLNNSGRARAEIDRKNRKEGRYALHLAKTGGMPFDVLRTDIRRVAPGTRVTVSARVKARDLGNAFLKFWVYDQAGEPVVQDVDVKQLRGTFSWERVEKTYDLPRTAASAAVMVVLVMGGDLWIDDVRVEGAEAPAVPELPPETRAWLDENAVKLASLRFDAPSDDLAPMRAVLEDARIVQLGEMSHGDGPAFRLKARIAKFLHREMGFDVLAFEGGLFECDEANALLAEGKVREAMFGSVPGVWRVAEVQPLFAYMAEQAASERPLRLAGWDVQATGGLALELPARLAEFLGDEAVLPKDARERMQETTKAIWDGKYAPSSKRRRELLAVLDDVREALEGGREALDRRHGGGAAARMERALENFRLWEEAAAKPPGGKWGKVNARDARMADNLRWQAEVRFPDARIITWGATMHLMHGAQGIRVGSKAFYRGCRPMGEAVHEAWGPKVYTIGFAAHHGRKGTPFWGPFEIDEAPPGSIEDVLHRYGEPLLFVDLRRRGPFHAKLQAGPLGYSRDMVAVWPKVIDGLVFTDENVPSTVMAR